MRTIRPLATAMLLAVMAPVPALAEPGQAAPRIVPELGEGEMVDAALSLPHATDPAAPAEPEIAILSRGGEGSPFLYNDHLAHRAPVDVAQPVTVLTVADLDGFDTSRPIAPRRSDDDSDPGRTVPRDALGVGVGILTMPSYGGSDDRVLNPGLLIRGRISGYAFSTRGTNLQVDVLRQRRHADTDWKLGPYLYLRSERTGRVRDPIVALMAERDPALEVGLFAGVSHTGVITSDYDQISARVTVMRDITGVHGSWIVSPTVDYGTPLSRHAYLGVTASLNIYGRGFGRYYYDVDAADSLASGLPLFSAAGDSAEAGKLSLGMGFAHSLTGDLRGGLLFVAGAQYGRILGDYADSPIVALRGDADQWLGGLGLAFQF